MAQIQKRQVNEITDGVIGAAIEVHRALGPGWLESAYVQCLCHELHLPNLPFRRELSLPVNYKGLKLDCGYRVDMLVADTVVVEVKAVERLAPVHEAQLLTYLRLGGWKIGLSSTSTSRYSATALYGACLDSLSSSAAL